MSASGLPVGVPSATAHDGDAPPADTTLVLLEQHWRFLRDRGVADDVVAARGYRSAIRKADLEKLGFGRTQQLIPALVIPIWSVRGAIESHQLRPDKPRLNGKGKPRKYELKAGSKMLLDVHPSLSRPREDGKPALIADPAVPLFITEGIPKADSAISIGLSCLALLGVWNWRGSNQLGGKAALADWESVALNDRTVLIAFDSDVVVKREVHAALARLKTFLESRHAAVKVIYLPVGEHGEKTGLDDFIAREKAAGKSDADIRDALLALATEELRQPKDPTDDRPKIEIVAGRRPWMVDRAEEVILDHQRWKLFQRGGIVCRVVEFDPSDDRKIIRRPNGAVMLKPADPVALEDILTRAINWCSRNAKGELVPEDCPPRVAFTLLARGQWRLPFLAGIIEAPTILADGTMVESSGYDPASGLFLYSRESWLPVPEKPTRTDAQNALAVLTEPFSEFPFIGKADRAVIVSAILTGLVRRQLESAPIHGLDAPIQGSGKSLLADSIAIILTGRVVASMPLGGNTEEIRKRLTSILLAGDLIVNIDNITRPLESDSLAMIVTQPVFADRLLGKNERPQLLTNLLFLVTANNLVFAGDLATRAIVSRIDPQIERPEERTFTISDLRGYVRRERARLVQAALTVLRAHCIAGRPCQNLRPFGRFEEWSGWVRAAIVWAGGADPVLTRERISLIDPEHQSQAAIFSAWFDLFADRPMLLHEIVAAVESADVNMGFRQALLEISAAETNPQKINTRRLAGWCRAHVDRIAGDLRLTRGDRESHKTGTWRILKVARDPRSIVPPAEKGRDVVTDESPQIEAERF